MSNYVFKGVYIPASVWLDDRLSPTQKMLLCEIDAMSDGEKNPCFALNPHFAKHLKCTPDSISNMIAILEKLGYLYRKFDNEKTYEGRKMWTNFGAVSTPPSENGTPPSENGTPPSENGTPPSENGTINKPINSPLKKPLNNSSMKKSKKRDFFLFNSFRDSFIEQQGKDPFYTEGLGWRTDTPFVLSPEGLIINTVSLKLLTKEESLLIWNYLHEINKSQKLQKQG